MSLLIVDENGLSVEQRIVLHLSNLGYLTSVGDVTRALKEQAYAEYLVTGNRLNDDVQCDHKALTNEEIQEVFDNDED